MITFADQYKRATSIKRNYTTTYTAIEDNYTTDYNFYP